jgi:hypothetical protein
MKKLIYLFFTVSVIVIGNKVLAQTTQKPQQKQVLKTQPVKKSESKISPYVADSIRLANATPGNMHELLYQFLGAWQGDVIYYSSMEKEPIQSGIQIVYQTILNNKFIEGKVSGDINKIGAEGISLIGFDNSKKTFVATWIDINHTGIVYLEGDWREEKKTIHFHGKQTDAVTGKESTVNINFTVIDDFNHSVELFILEGQEANKLFTINFRRG